MSWNFAKKYRGIIALIITILAIAVCIFIALEVASPVSASVFIYGSSHNYSVNVLPNNSYVHQGENISQGCYYDLTGVYGWSGYLGMWNYEDDVGFTIPDHYISLNGGANQRHYYIDPEKMPVGTWYQIDKFDFAGTSDSSASISFGSGNALAFHVVGSQFATKENGELISPAAQTTISTKYTNITQYDGDTIVHIPVSMTVVETVTTQDSFVPAGDVVVITVVPTTTETTVTPTGAEPVATEPVKEAPLPMALVLIALAGVILWRAN